MRHREAELAHASRVTSLGVLAASIAHEVNQPLSGIITNAGTCLRMLSVDPPNVEGACETARRAIRDGNRAAEVVTRLRKLYTKKEPTPEPLDLNEAAREVIALSLSRLQRDGVILRQELADDLPLVTGDHVQLQQVVLNLILNAADAMSGVEDRPKELLIRTERAGDGVRLTVQDAGIGIQPEAVGKLLTRRRFLRPICMRVEMMHAACVLMLFGAASSSAQDKTPAQVRLDQKVPVWLKAFNVTSVGIAYIENGQVAWTSFYGEQIPGGPSASTKTLYSVASLTKPITAELILRLAAEGKLSLDEPIFPYWIDPDVKTSPWNQLLTARLCLSHQTGFPNWRYLTKNVLIFRWVPGTNTGYSGEGYDYVARFAEKKTGQSFEHLAQHYVFDPIGMKDTSYTPQSWWADRQAKPVESEPRTKWDAADLLRTTVSDYANFLVSVMRNDQLTKEIADQRLTITRNLIAPEKDEVLCEASVHPQQCHVSAGFGLGWHIVNINGQIIADHTGGDADVKTFAFFIPKERLGAVVFTNGPDVGHEMIDKILFVLYPNPVYAETLW